MNLKSLVHWELSQGLTEEQLASAVGVPLRTVTNILRNKEPHTPVIWEKFGRYFRMNVDFLRKGESTYTRTRGELPARSFYSAAGEIRNIPLLDWYQMDQLTAQGNLPDVIRAEAMVEATDVSGTRTFALKVQDDSMEPLFSEGEIIFVNPDLECKVGDYVIANHKDVSVTSTLLRQVKALGHQYMLHALNRNYEDVPLTTHDVVRGKVVRLRKNL